MKLKTVSVDVAAFRLLRKAKGARESYGDTVRRVFSEAGYEEIDVEAHIAELFRRFGGKGLMTEAGRARVLARQKKPPHSRRPARRAV